MNKGNTAVGTTRLLLFFMRSQLKAIPHNSKCRYGKRGTADAKPKAQIILDAAKVSAASGGNSEPKQRQRSQSARGFCPRSTMRVPQPDIIEHFGNADAVLQLPERCLSRKAGIVRSCPSKIRKDVEAMKRFRLFYGGLAGLAAACALGAWFAPVEAGWLAFPWGSIGAGLRVLSLSGSVGNVAACGLYALLCLLPAGIALRDIRHRWPLVGFSAVLGPALYFLINPGLLAQRMGGLPQEVVVAMLGQLIWAVALACAVWLLLGALHRRSLNTSSLLHGMQIGLCLLDGAFVVSVFGVGVLDLRGQIAAVRQANTMLDNTAFGSLNPTTLFLVCGWLVQSLPALLNLGIVHGLLQLVKLAKADRFAPGMAQAAAHCGTLAGGAAAVDVTVQAVFLAVQLCAAGQLHQLNSGLHIALLPVLFAVAALLFSRWLAKGCALREENEGFI